MIWYYDPQRDGIFESEYLEEDVVLWVHTFPTWPNFIYFFKEDV